MSRELEHSLHNLKSSKKLIFKSEKPKSVPRLLMHYSNIYLFKKKRIGLKNRKYFNYGVRNSTDAKLNTLLYALQGI